MGSFSWLKADNKTRGVALTYGSPFKLLIPKEFGGGFIEDHYQDYGYLGTNDKGEPKYDIYELLAFWNADTIISSAALLDAAHLDKPALRFLTFNGSVPKLKEIDEHTEHNRTVGIEIACYDEQMAKLKYPLKIVSASFKGTYEDCKGISYSDPGQGFSTLGRYSSEYARILEGRKRKFKELGIPEELATKGLT